MDRQQLSNRIHKAWMEFKESYTGLSDAQMVEPGVIGDWSVKDVLAHITIWEQEALKYLPLILKGERPPRYFTLYGGIDAFNERMIEQKRKLSLADVLKQFDETHRQLLDFVQSAPEDQISQETRFRHRLRLETYSHYPQHSKAVLEWRERQGLSK